MKYLGWEVYKVGGGRMCHTQMGQCTCDTLRRWGRERAAPEFSMGTHNIQGRHAPARRTGGSNHRMWVKTEQNARLPGMAPAVLVRLGADQQREGKCFSGSIMEAARERTKPLAFLCSTPQLCPSLFPLHSPPNPTPVPASGLPPTSPLGALTHGRCQPLTLQSLYQIFVFNHRLRLHVHGLCRDVENSVPLQFVPSI